MRKFVAILSIFFFLAFNLNTQYAIAQPKRYTQGFYTMKDLGLSANIPYSVQNFSPTTTALILVVDQSKTIQQLLRLPPSSPKYNLTPLQNSYHFIIYGDDVQVTFS
ncbi:hypothetical protein [uncultured Clostridium sp.]|uniref:hypothetical protein n=1 Tax=uncultured Clostridium sp. TaxID=59620 RepID=UPI0028ECA14A|nr:hypothetical protein [uncultured Clostridium sp.]